MQFFLLGLVALALILLLLRGFTRANVAVLARQIRTLGGVMALAGAAVLVIRGLASYAMPLAALGSWLLWGHGTGGLGRWRATPQSGQTSRVVTDTLDAELDHDTGVLRGSVRTGRFAGRALEAMTPAELAELWRECRFADPPSAQIIEAWLDRTHPSWHDDMARQTGSGEPEPPRRTPSAAMTRAEAYEILGLSPGATPEQIRRAHRELMMKLHPDHGGSTFLAAKINEAKDMLLDGA